MRNCCLLISLLLFFSCVPDKNEKVDLTALRFSTSDASELYFKNVRESYYNVEDREDQGIKIYRFEDWNYDANYPLIDLQIVYNWRNDNAFVMASPNAYFLEGDFIQINSDSLKFEISNMKDQLEFSSRIYNAIVSEQEMLLLSSGSSSFMSKSEDRENFKILMYDFYRLTETF